MGDFCAKIWSIYDQFSYVILNLINKIRENIILARIYWHISLFVFGYRNTLSFIQPGGIVTMIPWPRAQLGVLKILHGLDSSESLHLFQSDYVNEHSWNKWYRVPFFISQ